METFPFQLINNNASRMCIISSKSVSACLSVKLVLMFTMSISNYWVFKKFDII